MGNMVVIAVRHSNLNAVRKLNYETVSSMMHDFETVFPKFFDGRHVKPDSHAMHSEAYNDNVLFSGYYHASDNANLVVSNELMSYIPSGLCFYDEFKKMKEGTNIADTLLSKISRSAKDNISAEFHGKKVSIKKSQSKNWNTVKTGGSFSLFGVLTDQTSTINPETVFQTIANAIEEMPWIEDNNLVRNTSINSIDDTPLIPLGNYQADQLALISMSGNVFSVLALPNYGFDVEGIELKINESTKNENHSATQINSYQEIFQAFKRNITIS